MTRMGLEAMAAGIEFCLHGSWGKGPVKTQQDGSHRKQKESHQKLTQRLQTSRPSGVWAASVYSLNHPVYSILWGLSVLAKTPSHHPGISCWDLASHQAEMTNLIATLQMNVFRFAEAKQLFKVTTVIQKIICNQRPRKFMYNLE